MAGFPAPSGMRLVFTTTDAGVPLINGTQQLASWTAPNDGALHSVLNSGILYVTSALTGGLLQISFTLGGFTATHTYVAANAGAGSNMLNAYISMTIDPGTTITITQATAITAGAGSFFYNMWAY